MTKLYGASTLPYRDGARFDAAYETLPRFRRDKIDTLRFPEDKCRSLCAWLLLTRALELEGISSRDITLSWGENGKPHLAGMDSLCFNLSHSGDRVLCALSSREVGCDVELLRPVDLKLARRFFAPSEYEALCALPPEMQQASFFRLWTCKESFVKALGTGLTLPLGDFSLSMNGTQIRLLRSPFPHRSFRFHCFGPLEGYCYACCTESEEPCSFKFLEL